MQLGFVTAILPDFELRQVFQAAAEIGYDCVEVMCWPEGKDARRYAGVTHISAEAFTESDVAVVQQLAEEFNISISALGYYPNPLTPDPDEAAKYADHIQKVIVAAKMLGVNRMNTFIGRDWKKSVDENWPRFLQTWPAIIKFAEQQQVRIGIENCPMSFTKDEWPGGKNLACSPAIWKRMYADIPSPYFGLNYDPSHLVWMHMDYLAPVRDFANRIFHVHAKDVRINQHQLDQVGILAHPLEYHSPKLPGLGQVDWGSFFSQLNEIGYQGPVCVEVEDRAYEDSTDSCLAALRQCHTYLRNFIPERK